MLRYQFANACFFAVTIALGLSSPLGLAAEPDGLRIVSQHTAIFTQPPRAVPTHGMPDGPLLGNGDVGVVLAGPPEAQRFYIGKNDFWTRTPGDAKVIAVGQMELDLPALAGASYRQEQDMARAEVRGTFTKGPLTVRTRSWVDANANLLVTELQNDGPEPVAAAVRQASGAADAVPSEVVDTGRPAVIGRELYGGGRWYFDGEIADVVVTAAALSGKPVGQPQKPERFDGRTTWRDLPAATMRKAVSVAAWIKIAGVRDDANYIVSKGEWCQAYSLGLSNGRLRWAIGGTYVQTERPLETGKWLYVAGTFDGNAMRIFVNGELRASLGGDRSTATGCFTRKADNLPGGRKVAVVSRVLGVDGMEFTLKPGASATVTTAIVSDLDAKDVLPAAKMRVAELTPAKVAGLQSRHRQWWAAFWARSFIQIPDKEIEKRWYAALYVMGSCSRPGKVAPGLWGNWITTDHPNWQGDFHLNYNFQAPFYIVYASNHADLSLPLYTAVGEFLPKARQMAKMRGWKGVHFPVSIGPWGIPVSGWTDWASAPDAAYVAMNYIWYWNYTRDPEWLVHTGYPYLREVADFWEDYLKLENGRYVIHNDSIHEGSGDDTNPLLSLGLLRTLFRNMLALGSQCDERGEKLAKWQHILDHLSEFPVQQRNGKTVFRYSEKGMAWCGDNTLGIQHIFPSGAVGLDSDPKVLEISRNTIEEMHRWHDGNGFSSWYTACARVGYDPRVILTRLRAECDHCSMPNLVLAFDGGGIENVSGFLAIDEMLLQSHDGVLRFFPCWPKDQDARFGKLRAAGAFLVSAELKGGKVEGVCIVSEKGCDCTVVNPWPGRDVQLVRNGHGTQVMHGKRFTFATGFGETIALKPIAGER